MNLSFVLHPFPLVVICGFAYTMKKEKVRHIRFYVGSYGLLQKMFLSQAIIGRVSAS